jgi:transposase-like protein
VKGQEKYLYRAVDSAGQTIDFLLTAKRDANAAKRFFQKVFNLAANLVPRVINVDKNPGLIQRRFELLSRTERCPKESVYANVSTSIM